METLALHPGRLIGLIVWTGMWATCVAVVLIWYPTAPPEEQRWVAFAVYFAILVALASIPVGLSAGGCAIGAAWLTRRRPASQQLVALAVGTGLPWLILSAILTFLGTWWLLCATAATVAVISAIVSTWRTISWSRRHQIAEA